MEKNKLLLLPLFVGLIMIVYSWNLSYPLSVDFLGDFAFNHMSVLYWFSLPLLLASMYMIAVTCKNNYLKWIMTVCIVMTMYSASYFYYTLPTSDALFYRGLHEYFSRTKNLDFSLPGKSYFQWPSVFIFTYVATSVSGLELIHFEFLMYGIIGFLLATSLYLYASKAYKNGGFLAVVAFFIVTFFYLNYQFAAFTLALILLLLSFILSTRGRSFSVTLTMLVLFMSMTITHAYVPLVFIIFSLTMWIIKKDEQYLKSSLLTLPIYLVYLETSTRALTSIIRTMMTRHTEMLELAKITPAYVPIDAIAQVFVIVILVVSVAVCVAGFIVSLSKRKMRDLDKAIFLIGACWACLGIIVYLLATRAVPIAFIPISLGASYLFESRFGRHLKYIFLILLILFAFEPIHLAFFTENIFFQTEEAYKAENFFIDHYNWTKPGLKLAEFRAINYLESRLTVHPNLIAKPSARALKDADAIFYTVGLGLRLLAYDYTIDKVAYEERLNFVYNNGFSIITVRAGP